MSLLRNPFVISRIKRISGLPHSNGQNAFKKEGLIRSRRNKPQENLNVARSDPEQFDELRELRIVDQSLNRIMIEREFCCDLVELLPVLAVL